MPIYKSRHASNFTVIPNEVFKSGIKLESVGLLAYLLSLPHDWVVQKTSLHKQLGMGRIKLDTMFKDLQEHGYIISIKHFSKHGVSYEHVVYDKPFNGELPPKKEEKKTPANTPQPTDTPLTGFMEAGSMQLLNTNKQNKEYISTKEETSTLQVDVLFSEFLNIYSGTLTDANKRRFVQAEKEWKKLTHEEKVRAVDFARETKEMNNPPQFVGAPDLVLKSKRFLEKPHRHVASKKTNGSASDVAVVQSDVKVDEHGITEEERRKHYYFTSKEDMINYILSGDERKIPSFNTYLFTCKKFGLEQKIKTAEEFYRPFLKQK